MASPKNAIQNLPVKAGDQPADDRKGVPKTKAMVGLQAAETILVLGNSITFHPPKPEIGWLGNWGMAASSEENDFVHLLAGKMTGVTGIKPVILAKNIADFERGYGSYDIAVNLKNELDAKPDIVVIALAENVPDFPDAGAQEKFRQALGKLIGSFQTHGKPTVFIRSSFWPHPVKDAILREISTQQKATFIDISNLAKDPSNTAKSERNFPYEGVAQHPGDKGMVAIADAIFTAILQKSATTK